MKRTKKDLIQEIQNLRDELQYKNTKLATTIPISLEDLGNIIRERLSVQLNGDNGFISVQLKWDDKSFYVSSHNYSQR